MSASDDVIARRNVIVLVAAQAILGAQMPMIFVVGGLAGAMMADNPCFATLPISLVVIGSMTTAPWISPLMQRRGRRFGFFIGAVAGAVGAAIAAAGLYLGSFPILLLGSYFTGIYMSAQGFYRLPPPIPHRMPFGPRRSPMLWRAGFWPLSSVRSSTSWSTTRPSFPSSAPI